MGWVATSQSDLSSSFLASHTATETDRGLLCGPCQGRVKPPRVSPAFLFPSERSSRGFRKLVPAWECSWPSTSGQTITDQDWEANQPFPSSIQVEQQETVQARAEPAPPKAWIQTLKEMEVPQNRNMNL